MSRRLVVAGVQAVEMEAGRITRVGQVGDLSRENMTADHYPSGHLLPALHDHHFHPFGYAATLAQPSLAGARNLEEVAVILRRADRDLEPGVALVANRLDDERLTERRLPTREELDSFVPERPVLVNRYCGHVAVANSPALALAGVKAPSGILREEEIQPVVAAVSPRQSPLRREQVEGALTGLAALGLSTITAIISAGEPLWCGVPDEVGSLLALAPTVPLDFEVLVIAAHPKELRVAAERLQSGPANVTFKGWKEFADGSLGGRTAALHQPYDDDPGNRGLLRLDRERARAMASACLDLGGTVAIHAIGDLANDRVLELFEDLIAGGADPEQLRIEHASVLPPQAVERMGRLGITASVQPPFITSETGWLHHRLGERVAHTYPLRALHRAGVRLLGGSDCPVESPNPFAGLAAAVTGAGLDPPTALSLYSRPLQPGQPAHLLIVDRDPVATIDLAGTRVLAGYRHGQPLDLLPATAG